MSHQLPQFTSAIMDHMVGKLIVLVLNITFWSNRSSKFIGQQEHFAATHPLLLLAI